MAHSSRTALFIDGGNFHACAKALGLEVDYKRVLSEFQEQGALIRAYYFSTIAEDQEYSSLRPLFDWLEYHGFTVVSKPVKEYVDSAGRHKLKGNMRVEIAVAAMEMAGHIDQMILFSGDGDFRCLVESMQRRGVRVTVVSSHETHPSMVADELRRQADEFVDLHALIPRIKREPSEARMRRDDRDSN